MTTPRIVLSMGALQGEHAPERGIARYVTETTRALLRAGAPVAALGLSPHRPVPAHFPADLRDSGLLRWATQPLLSGLRREGPVVLHVFSPFELVPPVDALFLPAAAQPGAATTATFYDAIPQRHPAQYLDLWLARVRYDAAAAHLRAVERVFAISAHAAHEAVDTMGVDARRVVTVGAGASETFVPARLEGDPWPTLRNAVPGLREGFVLTVGGSDERKNVRRLLEALPHLPDDVQLVQVGRTDPAAREEWHRLAAAAGGRDRLLTLDVVPDAVLRRLYQACAAFVFVSLEEGFGLPVLEAARSGAVIVTSDRTSVPEVLDEPATTVDPLDPVAIARAVQRALHDDAYRALALAAAERAVARHTWEAVAQRMMGEWAALPLAPRARGRARVGIVAHVAGNGSAGGPEGRANLALAAAVAEHADVTVFAADPGALASVGDAPCTVLPAAALGTTVSPHTFDHVVHVVADEPTAAAAAALWRWPGVAMVPPSGAGAGLGIVAALPGHAAGWVEGEFDLVGERLAPAWRDGRTAGAADLPAGVPFGSAPLLARCPMVVAPSARDAALVQLDLATHGAAPAVAVVPPVVVAPAGDSPDGTTIVVLGPVDDRLWLLLHLTTGLHHTVQVFQQGPAADPAPPWNIVSRASTTGATFDQAWLAALRRAAVVVDLGAPWGRAAALEAVGHGVPVITTGAWAGGVPAGVVRRLEADASDLALLGHVLALAGPSPLRRHQLATADSWRRQSSPTAIAERLMDVLDGRPGLLDEPPPPGGAPSPWLTPPRSAVCRAEDLRRPEHLAWCGRLAEAPRASRKLWEYTAISTTLDGLG
ncbi:MAG: glycosyltransferase family 4 protein, partial [Ilumatobacter sp.]|nr:glycosyltransferase family 4 protein [Ilumatobacter sp.]